MTSPRALLLLALTASVACADIRPIEDGATYGPVTVVQDWFTSAALLDTGAGPVLIDAGFRRGAMKRGLAEHGVAPEDVAAVLLTHGHGDHVGALSLYTEAEVGAHAAEQPLLARDDIAVARVLNDRELLRFGDTVVEVHHVPGHTDGAVVYLVDGVLLLGDTCLVDGAGDLVAVSADRSDDPAQADASLAALARLLAPRADEIAWLVPSHSGALAGFQGLEAFAAQVDGGD